MQLTFINFVANFRTLLTTLSSSFLLGFFSILRYTFICNQRELQTRSAAASRRLRLRLDGCGQPPGATCSVRSTDELLYLQSVSEPSVDSRRRKKSSDEAQTISSQLIRDSRKVLWLCSSWEASGATLASVRRESSRAAAHADATDLSADDDRNRERQQEHGGDDDVHRPLRPSSLPRTKQAIRHPAANAGGLRRSKTSA